MRYESHQIYINIIIVIDVGIHVYNMIKIQFMLIIAQIYTNWLLLLLFGEEIYIYIYI